MNFLSVALIGLGLAMDAFAVSVTSGILLKDVKLKHACKIAFFFGGFQSLMPLLGWLAGKNFESYITKFDHWIAFILLLFIGGNMMLEARKECCDQKLFDPLNNKVLIGLAIATSIDALIVGVSFAFLDVSIFSSIAIIGIITFLICFIGVLIGKKCSCVFRSRAETLGGLILILIGLNILFEHLNINIGTILNVFK